MGEILDLSTLGTSAAAVEAPIEAPNFDDLTPEQQASLADKAGDSAIPVRTAYLVFIDYDNNVFATDDVNALLDRDHSPSKDEIYGSLAVLQKDIASQDTAGQVHALLIQQAQAAQQQMEDLKIRQALAQNGGKGPRGGQSGNPARR